MKKVLLGVCALAASAAVAQGQVRFNEVFINAPGADQGREFIELISDNPNFSMDGLTILVIEGDCGGGCVAGTIDQVLPLSGLLTGANRLFLWPARTRFLLPELETVIFVQDFAPTGERLERVLIVEGFTGFLGQTSTRYRRYP